MAAAQRELSTQSGHSRQVSQQQWDSFSAANRYSFITEPKLGFWVAQRPGAPVLCRSVSFGLRVFPSARHFGRRSKCQSPCGLMHALIIEDDPVVALIIEECLRQTGFKTFSFAEHEEEAIATASERCPDLITADVFLASGCGIDAVKDICNENPIPLLYITSSASVVLDRCPDAVVVGKPFRLSEVQEGVDRARSAV